jgi:acyl-coenzyme A synthetase/AMP-(fatty) acid ligase
MREGAMAATIAAWAFAEPDRLAISDGRERLSWGGLATELLRVAGLVAGTTPPGAAVAVRLSTTPLAMAALLGVQAAGRVVLLIPATEPPARSLAFLRQARPALLLVDPATALEDPPCPQMDAATPAPPLAKAMTLAPDAPSLVLTTSGSTGVPKGIVWSAEIARVRCGRHVTHLGIQPDDRMMTLTHLATSGGLTHAGAALLAGASVLLTDPGATGAGPVQALAAAERPTLMAGITRLVVGVLRGRGAAFASLRAVRMFGTPTLAADVAVMRAALPPGCRITTNYGMTEVQVADGDAPDPMPPDQTALAAGRVVAGQIAEIVGPDGALLPDGEAGELVMRSPYVALGEWRDGRVVAARMLPDPAGRRLATGDLVRRDADGVLWTLGRIDRQAKIAGQRVEPAEVEAVLRAEPGLQEIVVWPVAAPAGMVLHAAFVPDPGEDPAALSKRLAARAAASLPGPLRPVAWKPCESLPRLPGGKVDLLSLP